MRVVIFTCRRDAEKAACATRSIPPAWSVVWVVDQADADMIPPAGVDLIVAPFARGACLIGSQAVVGVAKVLAEQAELYGRVAKIDSDCLLIHPDFLLKGDLAGMAHPAGKGAAYGLAYAMALDAALRAYRGIRDGIARGVYPLYEDAAITRAAQAGGGVLPKGAMWETTHRGQLPPKGAVAIHCGGTAYARREGGAVAKEMIRLGDALGLWLR